jgi:hypothetical protein
MFRFTIRDALWLTVVVVGLGPVTASAQEQPPTDNRHADAIKLAFHKLTNSEIDWDETTFGHAGPKVKGRNARAIQSEDVGISSKLLPLLEKEESFIAAHVLLTKMWRVPDADKRRHSKAVSTGYSINYNGLDLRLEWTEEEGQIVKKTTTPDAAAQAKRLSTWWSARFREHPQEFSPSTFVE